MARQWPLNALHAVPLSACITYRVALRRALRTRRCPGARAASPVQRGDAIHAEDGSVDFPLARRDRRYLSSERTGLFVLDHDRRQPERPDHAGCINGVDENKYTIYFGRMQRT